MKKNNKDSLGDRMKRYESVSKTMLMHRNPTIIRIDGKAFHTFTRGFVRPFDDVLIKSMQETMKYQDYLVKEYKKLYRLNLESFELD